MELGFTATELSCGAVTVRAALALPMNPSYQSGVPAAVMVTGVLEVTGVVWMVNCAEADPSGTHTWLGRVADDELLLRATGMSS
jgi:hypothetical protein